MGKYIVTVDYVEVLGAEHVPERGGGQDPGGFSGVGHVHHGGQGVEHLEVDHGVHGDSHAVLGEDLLRRDVECDRSQVNLDAGLNIVHINDKRQYGAFSG